jgi:hypothetical protein
MAARLQKATAVACFVIAAGLLALSVLRADAARAGLGSSPAMQQVVAG